MHLTLTHATRKRALEVRARETHLVRSDTCSVDQVCLNKRKKRWPKSGHLDRTSLVNKGWKKLDKKRNFSCRTNAGNPKRAKWTHLSHSSRQSERQIHFIFSHIINFVMEEGQVSKKLAH